MFARFDENPAMTLQDIKETKRYGRTNARTHKDNVKTVYPPQTKFARGIIIFSIIKLPYAHLQYVCNIPAQYYKDKRIHSKCFLAPNFLMHIFNMSVTYSKSIEALRGVGCTQCIVDHHFKYAMVQNG